MLRYVMLCVRALWRDSARKHPFTRNGAHLARWFGQIRAEKAFLAGRAFADLALGLIVWANMG
jgi:hypothetical protein